MNPGSMFRQQDPHIDSHDGSCGKFGSVWLCAYYDVVIYYVFLYVLCAVAILSKFCREFQRFLSRPLQLPLMGYKTMGEIWLVIWFIGLLVSGFVLVSWPAGILISWSLLISWSPGRLVSWPLLGPLVY